jgi:hypothetical protein
MQDPVETGRHPLGVIVIVVVIIIVFIKGVLLRLPLMPRLGSMLL